MINRIKILVLLFLCSIVHHSWAQFNYSKSTQEAQNAILDLDFVQYGNIRNHQSQTEKGIFLWLDGYKEFVYYQSTSKSCDPDLVIAKIRGFLSSIEKLADSDPFYYYGLTDLHLFLCFLYFEKNEPLRSFEHYLYAKNLLKACKDRFPEFEYSNKHQLVQFVINDLINRQLGIRSASNQEMQNAYIKLVSKYLQTKNSVYKRELKLLGMLLFNLQFDSGYDRAIIELGVTMDYAKTGPIESLGSVILFKKADFYSKQLFILENANKVGYQKNLNILALWYGNMLFNQQNDTAIYFINEFLRNQQNSKFVLYAQYKASMYWFQKGDISKSNHYNELIKQSTVQFTNDDKQAFYEISHAEYWTKELVEARLLFDGCEFKKALEVLLAAKGNVASYSKEQKLEYSYRIGRIYDKFNDLEKAKKFYMMVINSKLDDRFYYPAYAAFYLGNLYVQKGDYEKANEYFVKCTELDSPIYKSSIHTKAKQAIQ